MSGNVFSNWRTLTLTLLFLGSIATCSPAMKIQAHAASDCNLGLFGVVETLSEGCIYWNLNLSQAFSALSDLGIRRLSERVWLGKLFINEFTVNDTWKETLESIIDNVTAENVTILGVVQDFPNWMTEIYDNASDSQVVPFRDVTDDSTPYMKFLDRYEASWKNLSEMFPTITL